MLPYFSYKTSLRWQHLIIKHSRCDTIPENKNLLPFTFFKGKNCYNYLHNQTNLDLEMETQNKY